MKDFMARFRIWLLRRREVHALSRAQACELHRRFHADEAERFARARDRWKADSRAASDRIIDITTARLTCALAEKRRHDAEREAGKAKARTMRAVGLR